MKGKRGKLNGIYRYYDEHTHTSAYSRFSNGSPLLSSSFLLLKYRLLRLRQLPQQSNTSSFDGSFVLEVVARSSSAEKGRPHAMLYWCFQYIASRQRL